MTEAELDQLVAQIGEEILAKLTRKTLTGAEGLGLADTVCPGCTQRCAQTCEAKTRKIISCGADRISASEKLTRIAPEIASLIDHTLLKPEATADEVTKVCTEAKKYSFASVCINPYWVPLVAKLLRGSPVKVCTVIGFPLGANATEIKVAETDGAVLAGAEEVDMVLNVGALKSGDYEYVERDIRSVAQAAHRGGAILKVILETALLDDKQKAMACTIAKLAGADFVKTSTGFSKSGATAADIALMRSIVGPGMGVKASGGIRTLEDVKTMAAAGASRIGASASVKIMEAAAGNSPASTSKQDGY